MSVRWKGTIALFICLGIVFIFGGALSKNHPVISSVALNLGVVFIAIPLLDYVWRLVGGNPLDEQVVRMTAKLDDLNASLSILDSGKTVGLHKAYKRQGDYGGQADWEELIKSATRQVDVMGRAAYGWVSSNDLNRLLKRKIESDGVRFRWLIMSPHNRYLNLLTEEQVGSERESDRHQAGVDLRKGLDPIDWRIETRRLEQDSGLAGLYRVPAGN